MTNRIDKGKDPVNKQSRKKTLSEREEDDDGEEVVVWYGMVREREKREEREERERERENVCVRKVKEETEKLLRPKKREQGFKTIGKKS
jgi:hypothetical protein